jgi:alkanesulfonate monooxygenase
MAEKFKILWYINHSDGPYPWKPEGRIPFSLQGMRDLAIAIDTAGFYGALAVGSGVVNAGSEALVETANFIPLTKTMRFLIPIYPGVTPPAQFAQQARQFDEWSGGRLLINQVNGTDPILLRNGIDVKHDERYTMSAEYFDIFKKIYAGDSSGHDGKYFKVGPAPAARVLIEDQHAPYQYPHTPVWGSGASPAGIEHAGKVLDSYMTYLHAPQKLGVQIRAARASAAKHGRSLRVGTLANIIVRETEDQAWAHAQWLLEQVGVAHLVSQIDARLKFREFQPDGFDGLSSEDPKIQARIDALRNGRLPDARDLESSPNIWAGPSIWSALDILDKGWGSYLVGSAEQVAKRMNELRDELGIDTFILAGWPLKAEAERVAKILLPLLDLDDSLPVLTQIRGQQLQEGNQPATQHREHAL